MEKVWINITDLNGVILERFCVNTEDPVTQNEFAGQVSDWITSHFATTCEAGEHVEPPYWLKDARGIEVAKVCDSCVEKVKAGYRPEIFTDSQYETTEDVEPDDPVVFTGTLDPDEEIHRY